MPVVRAGVLKFGTVNWELTSMRHHGLDTANGFALEVVPFAGGEATDIALMGGEVDVIVLRLALGVRASAPPATT